MDAARHLLIIIALHCACLQCLAQSTPAAVSLNESQSRAVLEEAQQAYERGIESLRTDPAAAHSHFQSAAERFQLVVDSGKRNGPLYYNLANAYLQAGDLGRAILNYRLAQRLIPGDPRLDSNLRFARAQVRSQIAPSDTTQLIDRIMAWQDRFPLRTRWTAFLIVNTLFWLSLLLFVWRRSAGARSAAVVLGLIWLIAGASVAVDSLGDAEAFGVLVRNEVTVRKGNGTGYEPAFDQQLHAGVEFKVLGRRGDWLQVRFASGDEGWVNLSDAAIPPQV